MQIDASRDIPITSIHPLLSPAPFPFNSFLSDSLLPFLFNFILIIRNPLHSTVTLTPTLTNSLTPIQLSLVSLFESIIAVSAKSPFLVPFDDRERADQAKLKVTLSILVFLNYVIILWLTVTLP